MTIQHFEVHIIHSPEDAALAFEFGPLNTPVGEHQCANCGADIGCIEGDFIPLAAVVTDGAEFLCCLKCTQPIHQPRS